MREIQNFQVGIKAFMVNGNKELLLVQEARQNRPETWEIPGGRIDVGEELLPQTEILHREIKEELGTALTYRIVRPVTTWVRSYAQSSKFVFLIGFLCKMESGEIMLSSEHTRYRWVDAESWKSLPLAEGYKEALEHFWKEYTH